LDVHLVSHDSQKPYFFIWAEAGARGSEEISSAIIAFLDAAGVSATSTCKIIFWSDSCAGQNKNFYTVCLWQYLIAIKCAGRIDHKFPETGHSYLDSDRDFAHIEKCVRSRQTIFSVDEYQEIMTKSQSKNSPTVTRMADKFYSIKQLPDLLGLHNSHKNTDGQRVQFRDKVRWIRVESYGSYLYREQHDENEPWKSVCLTDVDTDGADEGEINPPVFDFHAKPRQQCQIKPQKLKDIQKQMRYIPESYKGFYQSLSSACEISEEQPLINDDSESEQETQHTDMPSKSVVNETARSRSTNSKARVVHNMVHQEMLGSSRRNSGAKKTAKTTPKNSKAHVRQSIAHQGKPGSSRVKSGVKKTAKSALKNSKARVELSIAHPEVPRSLHRRFAEKTVDDTPTTKRRKMMNVTD